ncbi:hypothetical protein [Alkalicoccus luteus]|uniref:Uncharacterized protein n=1 Tax=Alkalicoccus luteus TaxID=1237094 RepID=A0A969TTD7_9BACI|nr:hypothetical protein [Alkalicoccus luteus]NJP36160.1 hypothetical protein [Alkalicoccus luteus]
MSSNLKGKTHDLQETTRAITMYYVLTAILFLGGAGIVWAAYQTGSAAGLIVLGGTGLVLMLSSVLLVNKIRKLDQFSAYGIDEEKQEIWMSHEKNGSSEPLDIIRVPFSTIETVLLAPQLQAYTTGQGYQQRTFYTYIPVVLVVFQEAGQTRWMDISFRDDESANSWLAEAQHAGLSLFRTDESVNKLYRDPDAAELIQTDLYKEPFTFNGSVISYINRQRREDYAYLPEYTPEIGTHSSHYVTFSWRLPQLFIGSTALLLIVMLLDQWYVLMQSGSMVGDISLVGTIGATIVFGAFHILYGYRFERVKPITILPIALLSAASYGTAVFLLSLLIVMMQPHDPRMLAPYAVLFLPLMLLTLFIRRQKPAHHHQAVKVVKKSMRNTSSA